MIGQPSYSALVVRLAPGESVVAEGGAMMLMEGDIQVKTKTFGGVMKSLARSLFGGQTFFVNEFIAGPGGGSVWLAPRFPGHILYVPLENRSILLTNMAYLAHHGQVEQSVAWKGLKGLMARGEFFWLRLKGDGGVWITSFGHLVERELKPNEKVIVDNFHIVAMDDGMKWNVRKFGGLKSFLFGGEGLVMEIEGPGRIYLQTRTVLDLLMAIAGVKR